MQISNVLLVVVVGATQHTIMPYILKLKCIQQIKSSILIFSILFINIIPFYNTLINRYPVMEGLLKYYIIALYFQNEKMQTLSALIAIRLVSKNIFFIFHIHEVKKSHYI